MMPESRWITHSVLNPKPSLPTVTWPENPPSKYFAVASAIRSLMRERKASPTSIFLPETRNDMSDLRSGFMDIYVCPHVRLVVYARSARQSSIDRVAPVAPPDGGRRRARARQAAFSDGKPKAPML